MPIPVRILVALLPLPVPLRTDVDVDVGVLSEPVPAVCGARETAIVVDTRTHEMHLCSAGKMD